MLRKYSVDAFMEGIAFSAEQTARVFEAARGLGLPVKLHADQLSNLGGAALAARFSALRELIVTFAPSRASAIAQAFPRPLLDAQTMAERPRIPRSISTSPVDVFEVASRASRRNSQNPGQPRFRRAFVFRSPDPAAASVPTD